MRGGENHFTPARNSGTDPSHMGERVTIFGYGSQGRAQALNLRDSGWEVQVCLRPGSEHLATVQRDDLAIVTDPHAAASSAAWLILLVPDTVQPILWREAIAPALRPHSCCIFASGINLHFGQICPPPDCDCLLVAPLTPGTALRRNYCDGAPTPIATAIHQDATGTAATRLQQYTAALVRDTSQCIPSTCREETEVDLFSEQVLSCGGLSRLIGAAAETMIAAGYDRTMVYYSVFDEVRQVTQLFMEHGVAGALARISPTARYGAVTRGPRVIGPAVRAAMEQVLAEIRDGRFSRELTQEAAAGFPTTQRALHELRAHVVEELFQEVTIHHSPSTIPRGTA